MDFNQQLANFNELVRSIEHWNEYRVPILKISLPSDKQNVHFQGAMRFYFQDAGQKVATKCVNVTSADTTKDVIDILIEKFRPDMRMLSVPEYGLYEIHENGDERKLDLNERPILVQLEWNKDDLEGRFLLRRIDEKTRDLVPTQELEPSLKRKLSKKEKKKFEKLKKQQQKEQEKADVAANKLAQKSKNGIAERLYNELPETSFTRSISNPEAVMKRRRAQKLEKRLQEFSLEGGHEAGGTLRIFGEAINKDVSYKTLLLSTRDTAASVVKQILEKYGKDHEDPNNYCLIQLIVPPSATSLSPGDNNSLRDSTQSGELRESILEDHECPLLINQNHDKFTGILTFHIRPKPADYNKRRKKKSTRPGQQGTTYPLVVQQLNQNFQLNNNQEEYSNQNSPHASSQTSGSMQHVDQPNHLPPPSPMESMHSAPNMFSNGAGMNHMAYQQQRPIQQRQHPNMAAFLTQPRINNNNIAQNNANNMNGTLPRTIHSQPNMGQQHPNNMLPNGQFINPSAAAGPLSYNQQIQQPHPPLQLQQPQHHPIPVANDQILPALIQVREDVEDIFLNHVISHINPANIVYRLAPTYVLYMVSRYRASTLFHPELQAPSRAELFVPFTRKIATLIRNVIEVHHDDPVYLAFWLANSSDLCHFYKQDKHLTHFTLDAQKILSESVRRSFNLWLNIKQMELNEVLNVFFDDHSDQSYGPSTEFASSVSPIINVLHQTMATMRKSHVNPALAIQIFSNLFLHISKWLFDRLIGVYDRHPTFINNQHFNGAVYCNPFWANRLSKRLALISDWAESQGLEAAAKFHLARPHQVTQFMATPFTNRPSFAELKDACDKCDRLNPTQMKALLQRYQCDQPDLRVLIEDFLDTLKYRYAPDEFPLEEDLPQRIPFIIPDDGYSPDRLRYIPKGLLDFVSYLSRIRVGNEELCIFTLQPTSSGFWTVYFKNHQPDTPDMIVIQLRKHGPSMGLSIIAAKGVNQDRQGIYIKSLIKGGAAAMDGRLQAGDQLLEVDGHSLLDMSENQAAGLMKQTGPTVTLKVAKQAALHHNLWDEIQSASVPQIPPPKISPPQSHQHQPQMYQQAQQPILAPHQKQPSPPRLPSPQRQQSSPVSLVKSPKKVSWLDNQPHQSLHTFIPPSPSLTSGSNPLPSPPPPEIMGSSNQQGPNEMFNPGNINNNPNLLLQSEQQQLLLMHQQQQQRQLTINPAQQQDHNNMLPPYQHQQQQRTPADLMSMHNQHRPELLMQTRQQDIGPPSQKAPEKPLRQVADIVSSSLLAMQSNSKMMSVNGNDNRHTVKKHHNANSDGATRNLLDDQDEDDEDEHDLGCENNVNHNDEINHDNNQHHLNMQQISDNNNVANADFQSNQALPFSSGSGKTEQYEQQDLSTEGKQHQASATTTAANLSNGSQMTASESLTLEDIDEVLSSKTDTNWIEDSAGVIGTQEVYNDPRQRIVKAREHQKAPNGAVGVNHEELSFKEKLRIFNKKEV